MSNKLRHALAAKQNELRLLQMEEKSITRMENNIKVQLNRLRIEEMGLNNSILDNNVKGVTNRDDTETVPSDAVNCIGINKIATGGIVSSHTSQLTFATSLKKNTFEMPSSINKTDLNLMVPPALYDTNSNISDEDTSDDEEEKECLLEL